VQKESNLCERRKSVSGVNKVMLIGNVGKDPTVRQAASGTAVCRFSLATNETWTNRAGGKETRTEWHSVVAFGRLAEVCADWLTSGRLVYIEGSIRSGKWEDREGNERKSYDIVARYMRMLSQSANGNGTKPKETTPAPAPAPAEEDNPFGQDEPSDIPF
jgi:single-strand DNA-binding protein